MSSKIYIMVVGLPCSGKSTTSRAILYILKKLGYNPLWLNQDELGSRPKYFQAIDFAMNNSKLTHIILDKCYLDKYNRMDYLKRGIKPSLTIHLTHPRGFDVYKTICAIRFASRGIGHRMLFPKNVDKKKFEKICDKIKPKFTELKSSDKIMKINIELSSEQIIKSICKKLKMPIDHVTESLIYARKHEDMLRLANS